MPEQELDPRLTPARGDIAARSLEGRVKADKYCDGVEYQLVRGLTDLRARPDINAPCLSQMLYGEHFTAYEIRDGWAWGQAARDQYVGYCRADALSPDLYPTTHHLSNLSSHIYPAPDPKSPPVGRVYMMSELSVLNTAPEEGFVRLADGNWIYATHIARDYGDDPVSEALKFLYSPYLWGGRSCAGIDCSGLVQMAFQATGVAVPRDSDLQARAIGRALMDDDVPRHGDLAFFPGHVGFMLDDMHLLHANAHHMRVSIDPLHEVIDIVSFQTNKPPLTFIKRLD